MRDSRSARYLPFAGKKRGESGRKKTTSGAAIPRQAKPSVLGARALLMILKKRSGMGSLMKKTRNRSDGLSSQVTDIPPPATEAGQAPEQSDERENLRKSLNDALTIDTLSAEERTQIERTLKQLEEQPDSVDIDNVSWEVFGISRAHRSSSRPPEAGEMAGQDLNAQHEDLKNHLNFLRNADELSESERAGVADILHRLEHDPARVDLAGAQAHVGLLNNKIVERLLGGADSREGGSVHESERSERETSGPSPEAGVRAAQYLNARHESLKIDLNFLRDADKLSESERAGVADILHRLEHDPGQVHLEGAEAHVKLLNDKILERLLGETDSGAEGRSAHEKERSELEDALIVVLDSIPTLSSGERTRTKSYLQRLQTAPDGIDFNEIRTYLASLRDRHSSTSTTAGSSSPGPQEKEREELMAELRGALDISTLSDLERNWINIMLGKLVNAPELNLLDYARSTLKKIKEKPVDNLTPTGRSGPELREEREGLKNDLKLVLESIDTLSGDESNKIRSYLRQLGTMPGTVNISEARTYLASVYDKHFNAASRANETVRGTEREELRNSLYTALDIKTLSNDDRRQIGDILEQLEARPGAIDMDVARSYLASVYDKHFNAASRANETVRGTEREELRNSLYTALDIKTLSNDDRRQIGDILEQLEARPGAIDMDVARSYLASVYDSHSNAASRARAESERESSPLVRNDLEAESDDEAEDEQSLQHPSGRRQP